MTHCKADFYIFQHFVVILNLYNLEMVKKIFPQIQKNSQCTLNSFSLAHIVLKSTSALQMRLRLLHYALILEIL